MQHFLAVAFSSRSPRRLPVLCSRSHIRTVSHAGHNSCRIFNPLLTLFLQQTYFFFLFFNLWLKLVGPYVFFCTTGLNKSACLKVVSKGATSTWLALLQLTWEMLVQDMRCLWDCKKKRVCVLLHTLFGKKGGREVHDVVAEHWRSQCCLMWELCLVHGRLFAVLPSGPLNDWAAFCSNILLEKCLPRRSN